MQTRDLFLAVGVQAEAGFVEVAVNGVTRRPVILSISTAEDGRRQLSFEVEIGPILAGGDYVVDSYAFYETAKGGKPMEVYHLACRRLLKMGDVLRIRN